MDIVGAEEESGRKVLLLELNGKALRIDDGEGFSISEPAEPFRLGLGGISLGAESLDASLGVKEWERMCTWAGEGEDFDEVEADSSITGADIDIDTAGVGIGLETEVGVELSVFANRGNG